MVAVRQGLRRGRLHYNFVVSGDSTPGDFSLRALWRRLRRKGGAGSSVAGTTAIFAGGNISSLVLRSLAGLVVARFVEPSVLGLFNSFSIPIGYARSLQLGVVNGFKRELPYYTGKGQPERARELAATAQTWALFTGSLLALGLAVVGAVQLYRGRLDLTTGWLAYAVQGFIIFYAQNYLDATYRTLGEFSRLALVKISESVVSLLSTVFAALFGFYGLCLRLLAIEFTNLALLWRWRPVRVKPGWNRADFKHLMRVGLPIYITGQMYFLWGVADANLVLIFGGARQLGLYSLAGLVNSTFVMIPVSLTQVLFPMMTQRYGSTGRISELYRMAGAPSLMVFGLMLPLVAAAWFLIPPAVGWLVPKYVGGIAAAQWTLITALIMSFTPINNIFNIIRRNELYLIAIAAGLAVYAAALYLLVRGGFRLEAFPQAMIAGKLTFVAMGHYILGRLRLKADQLERPAGEYGDPPN